MLERNHYRETSADPDVCRVKTRRVSLRSKCHLGVWGRHDQECPLLNRRVWRLLARSQSGPGGACPSSVGSGRLRLWVRLFSPRSVY